MPQYVVTFCLIGGFFLAAPACAQSVLVRQPGELLTRPVDKHIKPAPGQIKGYAEYQEQLSAGSGIWRQVVDHEGHEKVIDLTARFKFDEPPARIVPGEEIRLEISGTLSGHSQGMYLKPTLILRAEQNYGSNFSDGSVVLYNRELPVSAKNTAVVINNAMHSGSISRSSVARLRVSKSASDSFFIVASLGTQKMRWTYKLVKDDPVRSTPAAVAQRCTLGNDFARVQAEFDILEKIKGNPQLYSAPVGFQNEPFEICIKDGQATLKGEPGLLERAAGIASTLLSLGVSGSTSATRLAESAVSGNLGSFLGKQVGQAAAAGIQQRATEGAKASGAYLSLQAIKTTIRNAEVAEKIAQSAMKQVFSEYEPRKIAESRIARVIGDGHLTVPAAEGLAIYRDMQMINDLARANAEVYYCKILESQLGLMREMRDLMKKATASESCQPMAERTYSRLNRNYRKLVHDLESAGGRSGYLREFGNNWTLSATYRGLSCVEQIAAQARRISRLR